MFEGKPYFYGTGRRKSSVARVRVYKGEDYAQKAQKPEKLEF